MIELRNITKSYDQLIAINDITLNIEAGERFVILGPSGCGKTTLLRLIAGFEQPDCGKITINGLIATNPKIIIPPHKRNIGMVFQDLALWPHMNVCQNIGFGLDEAIRDRHKREDQIDSMLTMVRLQMRKGFYPRQLSGGEQQRVALARALIRRPKILLMDEPLANLDFELKEKLMRLIMDLQTQFNITLVYVTHDQFVAKQIAEKIAFMRQGRIEQIKDEALQ